MSIKYDVIITGSGPAGATAANILSRKGFRVLIIERCIFPRKKICAGGLTPRTVRLLAEIGIISETELFSDAENVKIIKGVKVVVEDLPAYRGDFTDKFGACVNRKYFDNLLQKKAVENGAVLSENSCAFEPIMEKNRVCGVKYKKFNNGAGAAELFEERAKLIIIAEGAASPLTRKLSVFKRRQAIKAVNTVCETGGSGGLFEFYFDKSILPGYFWRFPFIAGKEYISAGFGAEKNSNLKELYLKLHKIYLPDANIVEPPATWIIPCDYPKTVFGEGWLLAGDAAGLANTLTGEGIYYAIKSGEFAALTAEKALDAGDSGVNILKGYKILIDDRFKKEYNISRTIKKLFPLGFHNSFFLAAIKKKGTLEKFMTGDMDFNSLSLRRILKYLFFLPFLALLFCGCGTLPAPAGEKPEVFPPYQSYLYYSRGLMLSNNLLFDEAIEEYKRSLALDPDSDLLNQVLAREYSRVGKPEEAFKIYDKILKTSKDIRTMLQAVVFYIEQENLPEAEKICKKIILIEPNNINGYFYLGNIYYKQDKTAGAIEMFNRVVEIDPGADTSYFNLGLAYSKKGDFLNAEKYYRKAVEVNPDYSVPVYALGLMFQIQGRPEKAIEEYNKLLEHSKFDPHAYKSLGLAYAQLKNYDEAVKALEKAAVLDPNDLDSLHRAALILYQEKKYQEVLVYAKRILNSDPANAEAYQLLGTAYAELGKPGESQTAYEKFVELDPANPAGYIYLAYLYTKKQDYPGMIELLEKGTAKLPENVDLKIYLGGAYFETKNYEKGETAYREALKLKKDDERALYSLGVLLERRGKFEEAVSSFKSVLALDPKNAEAYNYAGYIYADQNQNLEEALKLINEAVRLEPENGAYADSLGWVYFRMGKFAAARKETERAVLLMKGSGSEDAVIFEHLAEIYLKEKLTEKAVEMYEKSLKLLENTELRKKLNELKKTK